MEWSLYLEQQQLYALKYNMKGIFKHDSSFDKNYFPFSEHEEE
jgi:hypothetical protein